MNNKQPDVPFAAVTLSSDFIITTPDIAVEPTESIGVSLFNNFKKFRDEVAQIEAKTGERDTYGDLLERSIRTALHMADKQITRKDIITLCTSNHLNSAVPYIATQFLGAKMASLDPSLSQAEMQKLLNLVKPTIIFTIEESVPLLEEALKSSSINCELVVFGKSEQHTEFDNFLNPHKKEKYFEPVKIENLKDTAIIHFSSGTTGLPKGICLSHYVMMGQILNSQYTPNIDYNIIRAVTAKIPTPRTFLVSTNWYWLSASATLISCAIFGNCRLLVDNLHGEDVWDLIKTYKPFFIMLPPSQVVEMLANERKDVDVDCVLNFCAIGAKLQKQYALKLKTAFPQVYLYKGYGQTEVGGGITRFMQFDKYEREMSEKNEKIDSVGIPTRGHSLKVVDPETGKIVGPNQKGELLVKSRFIMNGYYNIDSSEVFDKDGWLKTGDIVYYDDDLCFYVVDRIKETFKYRGWFIVPSTLEEVLQQHVAVKDATVFGIPRDDGYHAMGAVILNEGYEVTEDELEKFVEARVPERQRLRAGVRIVDNFPLTITGKVSRTKLREMYT